MKILVALPCMGTVHTSFMNCLIHMEKPCEVEYAIEENSLVYDARDNLSAIAINKGCDYLLFIDSDMVFEPDLLTRLLETAEKEKADLVTALFFTRRAPFKPSIFSEYHYEKAGAGYIPTCTCMKGYPRDSVFKIAACGMAATLISTKALKDVWEREGTPFAPVGGFGEDLSFCIKLQKKKGYKLLCDSRVKVGHTGTFVANEDMYIAQEESNA